MLTSIGRHALLSSNRCRNPTQPGLGEFDSTSCSFNFGGNTSLLPSFFLLTALLLSSSSSPNGGDDTNRSFKVRLFESLSSFFFSGGKAGTKRFWFGICRLMRDRRLVVRVSSIRRVLLRRRKWTKGLVLGLRVGLCTTPHCVASSLNFCKVAISRFALCFLTPKIAMSSVFMEFGEVKWRVWNLNATVKCVRFASEGEKRIYIGVAFLSTCSFFFTVSKVLVLNGIWKTRKRGEVHFPRTFFNLMGL